MSDMLGKNIKTISTSSQQNQIDLKNISSGNYVLKLTEGDRFLIQKIRVEK